MPAVGVPFFTSVFGQFCPGRCVSIAPRVNAWAQVPGEPVIEAIGLNDPVRYAAANNMSLAAD